jgi:hypothetical protein
MPTIIDNLHRENAAILEFLLEAKEVSKANVFFGIFGEAFSKHCKVQVDADNQLNNAVSAFLELGDLRNKLAHQNFGAFSISKTSVEIYGLYQSALYFVEFIRKTLVEEKGVTSSV